MKIRKFAVTSLLAIAATGIAAGTAGTAAAAPAKPVAPISQGAFSMHGVDHGIAYDTTVSKDLMGVTMSMSAGKFSLTPDASAVVMSDPKGAVVGRYPTKVTLAGQQIPLHVSISNDGKSLTLDPARSFQPNHSVAEATNALKHIGQAKHLSNVGILGAMAGAAAGIGVMGAIGAAIGFMLGFVFFFVGAAPGAAIGLFLGGIVGALGGAFMGFIFI